jgi:hypothetical protein
MTLYVLDWLPALVNGGRAFVTIGAVEAFWIASEWPNGALEHFSIRLGVSRVREISVAFFFGNTFEK